MPKNSGKDSGKDRGSLTQKADDQQVRISQVSNVSQAVNAMGKETTRRMNETDRKIAEGGDSQEIAGSMNGVLNSLKSTIDSLNKGVETATLGTAKAATDAIKQYGNAISEDFKINRQNMVASALATSTPIFGYFASKFMETGIFKQTKDKMAEGISSIFKKKSKGGSMPDGMDDDMEGGGGTAGKKLTPAQAQAKSKQAQIVRKKDNLGAMKLANRDKYEKYDKSTEEKTLLALTAVQSAVGAQVGKFDQWYSKFLLQHPYYRMTMTAMKGMSATFGGMWKATYFFWRPRGGYKKHLSKSKQPFTAINQNLGAIFVQTMPRLDAIMIYTKATAIAVRDLSSHVTGKRYPMMDPSKLGGTWSLAGVTMAILRGAGRLAMKGARKFKDSMFLKGSKAERIFEGAIGGTETLGKIADYSVTGPGRLKDWIGKKTLGQLPGAKERKRLFGGLSEADETGGMSGAKKEQKCLPIYFCQKKNKKRLPKNQKGMGRRIKPDLVVQNVYDEFFVNKEKAKDKKDKKLLKFTAESAKYLQLHDKREKRRTTMGLIGGFFSSLGSIASLAMSFIGPLMGGFKKGVIGFITSLFAKGGAIRVGMAGLMAAGGPLLSALTSPAFLGPLGAAIGGAALGTWINNNIIKPYIMDPYFKDKENAQKKGMETLNQIRERMSKEMKTGTGESAYQAKVGIKVSTMLKSQQTWGGTALAAEAVKAGQMEVVEENNAIYAQYSIDEIEKARLRWRHSVSYGVRYWKASVGIDPKEFGRKKEKSFLAFLQKVGTKDTIEEHQKKVQKHETSWAKRRDKGQPKKLLGILDLESAKKFAAENGGHFTEYVDKTYDQAKKISADYAKEIKAKTEVIVGMTTAKAKEYADKYGGEAKEYVGLTIDQAKKMAEKYKIKEKAEQAVDTVKDQAKKISERSEETSKEAVGWFKSTFGAIKEWLQGEEPDKLKEKATKTTAELYQKSKAKGTEWLDKGAEEYNKNRAKLIEIYQKASPEKKAWIRQHSQELLAGGVQTANALKEMGIQFKDSATEAANKVAGSVVASSVNTSNNITNAVTQMGSGGGGGNQSKMMMEPTMDQISMGNVDN